MWYLQNAMKRQWLNTHELEEIQRKMLRKIIKHAYDNVPLYHEKFRSAGIMPDDIKTVEDLNKIPITTKEEIQKNFPSNIIPKSVDLNKCRKTTTSGSTGIPLTIIYDEKADDYEKAIALRPNLTCGQGIRDKWAVITSPKHIKNRKWFQKFGVFNPDYLSVFDNPKKQISILEKLNPVVLDGYASSIYLLAQEMKDSGNDKINPKLIYTTAEILEKNVRKYINSVFGVEVLDQFGCVELARTAWECHEHAGYHMDIDSVIMEFVSDNEHVSPGERGDILYTGLYNYSMPFIRYSIGDVGVPSDEKCPCGRGLPLMKLVEGRKDAYMQLPSGRILPPIVWPVITEKIQGIAHCKIIQEKRDVIKVQIVKGKYFLEDIPDRIKKDILNALGETLHIEIEILDKIPRDNTGKFRPVVSKVKISEIRK